MCVGGGGSWTECGSHTIQNRVGQIGGNRGGGNRTPSMLLP